ncbi:pupal cuticle protein 36-like [Pieris rapae]|uniref:pupal cuticle protein 36-like n=1 Tax=Pieris rapae TaxID=64459 RepID=UPI001E27E028|nr:pupal cuticle protein 36-like [Pieris rapae]
MQYVIILTFASMAAAAKLDKIYLPPDVASADGALAGLQAPFERRGQAQNIANQAQNYPNQVRNFAQNAQAQSFAQNVQSQNAESQAEILRFENEMNEEGFHYAYETSDGTKAEQNGRVLPGSTPEEGSIQVSGSYSYIGDDGQTYSVSYIADENGFQPSGDHLPTPPPIPEAILKSLQLTDREGKYSSQKSSYDADAGY